jgi:MFS transporter, NRE family, putaive nickel resistance protein
MSPQHILKPTLILFSLLWLLNGAGQALIAIPSSTLLAEHTSEGERGRAYSAHFALTHFCWLLSYPAIGHSAARWGAPLTFSGAGVVCIGVTVMAMLPGYGKREAHTH